MSTSRSMPAVGAPNPAPSTSLFHRAAAIVEVIAAFAFVCFRAIKHFTNLGRLDVASGLNFAPGLVMIAFSVAILLLCRRSFAAYGLTLAHRL